MAHNSHHAVLYYNRRWDIWCFNVSIYSLLYVYCIIGVCASEPHSSEFNATISVCLQSAY